MYHELGLILIEIVKHTTHGVVVFFPSYQLMEETVKNLNSGKMLGKLYEHKSFHIETKNL
jgi:Rad3-related DNA helicase